jgi:hypothetical protein
MKCLDLYSYLEAVILYAGNNEQFIIIKLNDRDSGLFSSIETLDSFSIFFCVVLLFVINLDQLNRICLLNVSISDPYARSHSPAF